MELVMTGICKDKNQIKEVKKGMQNLIRRIKRSSEGRVDYKIILKNSENGQAHTIINKK